MEIRNSESDRRSGIDRRSVIDRRTVNNFDHIFFSRVERRKRSERRSNEERRSEWIKIGRFSSVYMSAQMQ